MCLGIPGRIVEIVDPVQGIARAEVAGVRRNVSLELLEGEAPRAGDWVLIHVGFALARIDEAEAEATQRAIASLGEAASEELAALRGELE